MATAGEARGPDHLTSFVLGGRQDTLLVGDYSLYAKRLSKRILVVRKKLGLTTPKNGKFQKQESISVEQIKQNDAYTHLLLLNAERCWAKAMYTKSIQPEDSTITGANRVHIITKLNKAAKFAWGLHTLLKDSGANDIDLLQIRAYHASLLGAEEFEKQSEGQKPKTVLANRDRWNKCLRSYATTRVLYSSLSTHLPTELFQDFIINTVDPMLRYVAHQARLSRSIAVSSVALSHFPKDDPDLVTALTRLDANALSEQAPPSTVDENARPTADVAARAPTKITWRGHQAEISDAAIGQAFAQISLAEEKLNKYLNEHPEAADSARAAAYDDILLASQDAVDATKRATDELEKEGVDESDSRMQDLRVTSLYVQYELISWRVGRNRVLIGHFDGLDSHVGDPNSSKRKRGQPGDSSNNKRLAGLRQRLVLYDATLQSIESIKSIRGAQRDSAFVAELDEALAYFKALKSVSIAASHAIHSSHVNALALLLHARDLAHQAATASSSATQPTPSSVPKLAIDKASKAGLQTHIQRSITRHHALSEMTQQNQKQQKQQKSTTSSSQPLIKSLNQFPASLALAAASDGIVGPFPPVAFETVPVKPIFLDVAWNYIDYPGRRRELVDTPVAADVAAGTRTGGAAGDAAGGAAGNTVQDEDGDDSAQEQEGEQEEVEVKKVKKGGWFGFGRS